MDRNRRWPISEEPPDGEAIERVRGGERAAFAILVRRHGGIARRTAAMLGAGADTDDVVQEAFVKAYRALGTFRDGAAFRPWLLRIVANETGNARRAAGRRAAREAVQLPPLSDPADERHADLELFLRQVEGLPDHQRSVVACRFPLDLDEAQTAQVLRISRGTVKSRTHRALVRLRDVIADTTAEPGVLP